MTGPSSSPIGDDWAPNTDPATLTANLKEALAELAKRRPEIDLDWRYYDGDHPPVWLTPRLKQLFRNVTLDLKTNLCEMAVESVVERTEVIGFVPRPPRISTPPEPAEDPTSDDADEAKPPAARPDPAVIGAEVIWDDQKFGMQQEELWRAAVAVGVGYVMAWPRYDAAGERAVDPETGTLLYDLAIKDARNVYLAAGNSPWDKRWAAHIWLDTTAKCWRAALIYADEVVRYRTPPVQSTSGPSTEWPSSASRFRLDPDDPGGPNPIGRVCVYRFAKDAKGRSRLRNLRSIQDKINKLEANKMVTAEWLADPQRWALTRQAIPDDVLRPAPGSILQLDPGGPDPDYPEDSTPPTQVGQFQAAELSNYDGSTVAQINQFFTVARLPKHMIVNPGTEPSGDAVKADEGPHVAVCNDYAQMFEAELEDMFADLGYPVAVQWADTEVANGQATAIEVKTLVDAGVPVRLALRKAAGWSEEELAELDRLQDKQTAAQTTAGALALQALEQGAHAGQLAGEDYGARAPGSGPAAAGDAPA